MFKICLLLSMVLFASGELLGLEPKPHLDGRIVGGFQINITQVPWQVSLQTYGSHFCGGSIIGDKWILTAAHCTSAVPHAQSYTIRIGSTLNKKGGTLYKVKRIVQHKQYNGRIVDFDYSLLELVDSIQFSESAQPITLPDDQDHVKDNQTCLVTGWGDTKSFERNDRLRGAEVPIVNQEKCSKAYRRYGGVTSRMLCAGFDKGGKDACQGDSGGPLVAINSKTNSPVLVGVVSWGYGCAQPSYPGVYSRVQVARSWIRDNTGI